MRTAASIMSSIVTNCENTDDKRTEFSVRSTKLRFTEEKERQRDAQFVFERVLRPKFGDRLGRGGDAAPALVSTQPTHPTRLLVLLDLACDPEMFGKWFIDGRVNGIFLFATGLVCLEVLTVALAPASSSPIDILGGGSQAPVERVQPESQPPNPAVPHKNHKAPSSFDDLAVLSNLSGLSGGFTVPGAFIARSRSQSLSRELSQPLQARSQITLALPAVNLAHVLPRI
ncbi:hypothetical protein BJV74DRAFT_950405 [Russula compacta]|nr:hypothetical protein BJV74DRAFT_950405 [Russula compacta]